MAILSKEEIEQLYKSAKESIHALSKTVIDGLKPPSGAYSFFNNNAHALTRLEDCKAILDRLFQGREELTQLGHEENRLKPENWPAGVPYPDEVQAVMRKEGSVNNYMKIDLESLYMFAGILLDQWGLQAIAVANLQMKKQHPFVELIDFLEREQDSVLSPMWHKLRKDMLWLHYQIRFYRNRFIVHSNRPWQRGTTRSVIGDDFNLHTPTPPGCDNDEKINAEIFQLAEALPEHVRVILSIQGNHPDEIMRFMFNNIANFEKKTDRDRISNVFGRKGGLTPTFQVLAQNLFSFIATGTRELVEIANQNLARIDLGKPHATSDEMREKSRRKRT